MANLIQIKRSVNNATVPTLANGELAFTANGNIFYIGKPDGSGNLRIGGEQVPGVLTNNQALVANSTGYIDAVKTSTLTVTSISANGTTTPGAGYLLSVDAGGNTYWLPQSSVSINTAAQFSWTNTHSFSSSVTFNGGIVANGAITANGTSGTSGQVLTSDGTSVYWQTPVADITAVTAGDGLTGGGSSGDVTLNVGAGNGITVSADSISVDAADGTLTVDASGVAVNTNLSISSLTTTADVTVNGNTVLGSATSDIVDFNARIASDIMPAANGTYSLGDPSLRWNQVHTQNVHSVTGYFSGSVSVAGDVIVSGNLVTQNVSSLEVSDPLIYLAGNNYAADLVDIGFIGNYYDGASQRHAGLIRHADNQEFYLFHRYLLEGEDNVIHVDWANTDFTVATLNAYVKSGALVSNSTAVAITANSTVSVNITANSISLTTPLTSTSGGTGYNSYTNQDILVANTSNGFNKLALGTDGYVLQSNGSALVYSTLDGGTF